MKRLPVRFRPSAEEDLEEIGSFIAEQVQSVEMAWGFVQRIHGRCLHFGDAPHGAALRQDLGEGVRIVPFERSAVIAYRVTGEAVEIVGIFYGGRDYAALLGNDED